MKHKALQHLSDEQLELGKQLSPTQIANFLEDFRKMHENSGPSKLISIKIPEQMLQAFKQRCELQGIRYQTQIKLLMEDWLSCRK